MARPEGGPCPALPRPVLAMPTEHSFDPSTLRADIADWPPDLRQALARDARHLLRPIDPAEVAGARRLEGWSIIDQVPDVLGPGFAASVLLTPRWTQYLRRNNFTAPDLTEVMALIRIFYGPLLLGDRTSGHWQDGQWA